MDHAKVHRGQRRAEKLTALKVKAIVRASKPGRWGDGRNLYLVSKTGQSHSWDFSYRLGGKTGSVGLGSLNNVSLAEAREKARACRMTLRAGKAPERARAAAAPRVPTMGECIEQFIALNKAGWSVSTARQWRRVVLGEAVFLGKSVGVVTSEDVIAVLRPRTSLMRAKVQKKLATIFDWAIARGFRMSANPCNFKIGDFLEHHSKHVRKHQPAMPWRDLPQFLKDLREKDNLAARIVEFQILTCTRPKEARNAAWEEIDFAQAVWIIPASRMKARREHRVPLSASALALLRRIHADRTSPFVFPGRDSRKPFGATAVGRLMPAGLVLHGFRSTFTDWTAEQGMPAEVAERCLAHSHLSAVAAAYRRTDLLDQRRPMLEKWADFLGG